MTQTIEDDVKNVLHCLEHRIASGQDDVYGNRILGTTSFGRILTALREAEERAKIARREALLAANTRIQDYFNRREPWANEWQEQKVLVENIINSEIDKADA